MKTSQVLLSLAASLLLAAPGAQAQVEIKISGAVAFRDNAYRAIRAMYGANLTAENTANAQNVPVTVNKQSAEKVTWTGTIPALFGAQTVTVRAFYNGAVAGVQDLTQNRNVNFLATSTQGDVTTVAAQSDIAFSSIFQQATEFTTPVLDDAIFGATPINLVKSTSAPAGITNITSHQLKALAANGSLPAFFFTGDTNDTQTIHFINRDPTAGQRVTLFLESIFNGNPISYFWNGTQFAVDSTGRTAGQITTHLNNFGPAISYLISSDSFNVNGGQNVLSYNGNKAFRGTFNNVANDFTPIITGQYSLWVYEHLLIRTTAPANGNVRNFRAALITAIGNELLVSPFSIPVSRLRVERQADGAPVAPR